LRGSESHDFAPVSQHFGGEKENKIFIFFEKEKALEGRIELMRMKSSMYLDEMLPLEDQMSEVVVLDVLESCRCVFIYFFVLK
jgi:hypothetical protein